MTSAPCRHLYLVRHGEAKPKEEDPERGLSEAGHEAVSKMAQWIAASGIVVDEIRHSGKLRAQQTAEILAGPLGAAPRSTAGLAPKDDVAVVAKEIKSGEGTIMLVGHLPFLERLAALLVVGSAESSLVSLDAGSLVELTVADGVWRVTAVIQSRFLPSD